MQIIRTFFASKAAATQNQMTAGLRALNAAELAMVGGGLLPRIGGAAADEAESLPRIGSETNAAESLPRIG